MTTIESAESQIEKLLTKSTDILTQMSEDNLDLAYMTGNETLEKYENMVALLHELLELKIKYF